jgi:hypothetical protein
MNSVISSFDYFVVLLVKKSKKLLYRSFLEAERSEARNLTETRSNDLRSQVI